MLNQAPWKLGISGRQRQGESKREEAGEKYLAKEAKGG